MDAKKIGFFGLGLIGGTIARNLKEHHPEIQLIATSSRKSTIEEAYNEQVISNQDLLPVTAFADCDYIFLCAPVSTNIAYLEELKPVLNDHCIITDVGSVKGTTHKAIQKLGLSKQFIGGHPMAGSEKTGFANSHLYLFENAYYILTPEPEVPAEKVEEMKEFVKETGAVPMLLSYEEHDLATASISHLPHIISGGLVHFVKDHDNEKHTMKTIAAGGFRDITRISSSSPVMLENFCFENRENLLHLLEDYQAILNRAKALLESKDREALLQFFQEAKDYRDSLTVGRTGNIMPLFELYLDLIDKEGQIADITTLLAKHHVNIKNIGILHNREFEQGVLHIEFYEEKALKTATEILAENYTIYLR